MSRMYVVSDGQALSFQFTLPTPSDIAELSAMRKKPVTVQDVIDLDGLLNEAAPRTRVHNVAHLFLREEIRSLAHHTALLGWNSTSKLLRSQEHFRFDNCPPIGIVRHALQRRDVFLTFNSHALFAFLQVAFAMGCTGRRLLNRVRSN